MAKKKKEIVFAFIDSQNLNLGVNSQGWKLDFARFRKYLSDKYQVEKAFLFIGFIKNNYALYTFLRESGFFLIFKNVLEAKDKKTKKVVVKGNVDAELVLHAMINLRKYRKAVIVSGDGDFFCLVEYLEKKGKLKKIIVPNQKYSSLLRKYSGYILNVNNLRGKLEKRKRGIS